VRSGGPEGTDHPVWANAPHSSIPTVRATTLKGGNDRGMAGGREGSGCRALCETPPIPPSISELPTLAYSDAEAIC